MLTIHIILLWGLAVAIRPSTKREVLSRINSNEVGGVQVPIDNKRLNGLEAGGAEESSILRLRNIWMARSQIGHIFIAARQPEVDEWLVFTTQSSLNSVCLFACLFLPTNENKNKGNYK